MLDQAGGWRRRSSGEDTNLLHDVLRAGGRVYRTHPHGFLLVRHGRGHAWQTGDAYSFAQPKVDEAGFRPDLADISGGELPYSMLGGGMRRTPGW